MGLIGIPQWNLPGNHDIKLRVPGRPLRERDLQEALRPDLLLVQLRKRAYRRPEQHRVRRGRADPLRERGLPRLHLRRSAVLARAGPCPRPRRQADRDRHPHLADQRGVRRRSVTTTSRARTQRTSTACSHFFRPFRNVYGLAGHDSSNSWKVEIGHEHGWTGQSWIAHTLAEVRGSGWTRGQRDLRGVADAMMEDGNPNGFYLLKFDDVTLIPEFIPFPFGTDAAQRLRVDAGPGAGRSGGRGREPGRAADGHESGRQPLRRGRTRHRDTLP